MYRVLACLLVLAGLAVPAAEPPRVKLLIAFASYRERPKHPNIFFYEHDGVSQGKIVGSVATPRGVASAEAHPSLSQDGRYCAFTSELENQTGRIHLWDLKEQKLVELPVINETPNAQMGPSLSANGGLIAFAAWNRPKAVGQGWNVFLYDVPGKKLLDLPDLNSQGFNDRMPALSGDGRFIAFTSNRKGGAGLTDVYLYDRNESKLVALPEMNSKNMDVEPSLSGDGNLLAFVSDRPGGRGGRDIYLFDRTTNKLLPLPGLNTEVHEQSPALSPDGRFIAFVSERLSGEGERDIYLYDRQTEKLLPTPGLNSKTEDFDPCIIMLKD
jgi:Tol biopolymer transport system component